MRAFVGQAILPVRFSATWRMRHIQDIPRAKRTCHGTKLPVLWEKIGGARRNRTADRGSVFLSTASSTPIHAVSGCFIYFGLARERNLQHVMQRSSACATP